MSLQLPSYIGTLDIEIPDHVSIGHIIGPRGNHINRVREEYNVKISIKDDIMPRFIRIYLNEGSIPNSIRQYYKDFFDSCNLNTESGYNIEIPDYVYIGKIIGKNGNHIKNVNVEFNAYIRINKDISPNVINIINHDDNLDKIKQYYEKYFENQKKKIIRDSIKLINEIESTITQDQNHLETCEECQVNLEESNNRIAEINNYINELNK